MKNSDAIAAIVKREVSDVFGVTGGNIINVVDSMHKAGINIVPMHHEQSAAIAADAYARFRGFGVCFGTSGPGVTNLLTGVCCSHYDSVPVLAIGGQVPSRFLCGSDRQMGFQETNGVGIFSHVTKLSSRFKTIEDIINCIHVAKEDRQGPCFIEIPDDAQRQESEPGVTAYGRESVSYNLKWGEIQAKKYKKPLAIIGYGARNADLDIRMPFLYTWRTKDIFYNHPLCKGGFGITGGLNGNKLLKEADCVLMIGTRMDSHMVPNWDAFAPQAAKVAWGLEFPHQGVSVHDYNLRGMITLEGEDWCKRIDDAPDGPMYQWVDGLCDAATPEDVIIPDMGQTGCIVFQRWKIKEGQRLFNGMNHSPMGYALPGAIGATVATGKRVIVVVGDGSLMMNIHDLQTIAEMKLPINIFVVDNGGYGMIRQTQDDWKKYLAQGVACNFKIPNIRRLADVFGLKYSDVLNDGPSIGVVHIDDTRIVPKWKMGESL